MAEPTLDEELASYLARPVTGERLGVTWELSIGLVGLLQRLAQERGVPVAGLAEFLVFKGLRGEHARRLVGDRPDPIPASFLDDRVAKAKVDLQDERAARVTEERGDKASRIAGELQAVLDDASGAATEPELDAVRRQAAVDEAKLDLVLEKKL